MKYGDTFTATFAILALLMGVPTWLAVYFGGAYFAFAGYEDESGSVLGGILWLTIFGWLVVAISSIPIAVLAGILAAPVALIVWMIGSALRRLRQPAAWD